MYYVLIPYRTHVIKYQYYAAQYLVFVTKHEVYFLGTGYFL
jgi:hypothetical protein